MNRGSRTGGGGGAEADNPDQMMDWVLPNEAFQPRHEIKDRSPPPEHFTNRCFTEPRAGSRIGMIPCLYNKLNYLAILEK